MSEIKETKIYNMNVDCDHVFQFDRDLHQQLINYPADVIPIFDATATDLLKEMMRNELPSEDFRIQIRPFHMRDAI